MKTKTNLKAGGQTLNHNQTRTVSGKPSFISSSGFLPFLGGRRTPYRGEPERQ